MPGLEFETLKLCFRYQNTETFCTNIGQFHHWLFEIYHSKLLQSILFMAWMMYEPFLAIKSLNSVYNSHREMETNKVTLCCEQIQINFLKFNLKNENEKLYPRKPPNYELKTTCVSFCMISLNIWINIYVCDKIEFQVTI